VRAATRLPVVAGFGISTPEQVRDVCAHCDGVVVGSRLVQAIEDGEDPGEHVKSLKAATRR
jgi:tryptophan synthase alpha chain